MSTQRICDKCEQELTPPFFLVTIQKQSSMEGPLTEDGGQDQYDYHEECLPEFRRQPESKPGTEPTPEPKE